jgi:AAA+ superfamily predicted ATPase
MALSTVVETLLDHARSLAKRQSSKSIAAVHLIAGLRMWKEEQFDQHFPNLEASIRDAVSATKAHSIETPKLDDKLHERVSGIKTLDELWALTERLVDETGLKSSITGTAKPSSRNARQTPPSATEKPQGAAAASMIDSIPLGSIEGLVERIAAETQMASEMLLATTLGDLAWIHSFIVGNREPETFNSLLAESLADRRQVEIPHDLSNLVAEIDSSDTKHHKKLASQLAFVYADMAEWFAALDDKFEEVELERIDSLKERLIAQLGGVVDAEVGATQNFESKFNSLVGMQSVKTQIRKFVDLLVVQKRREKRGLKVSPQRLHMAFLGNPGTGKTTVARLYGELLHELGLMNSTKFVEKAGTDFTGVPHIGESEPVMRAAVKDALDGVLFIDEAYSMNDPYNADNKKGPGLKATDVLVKMMEDHRHQLCVIFAGYTDLTKEYLEANPGMPSRIGEYIEFPDYSPDEIKSMVPIMAGKRNLQLGVGTLEKLAQGVEASRNKLEFGNARSVEKILEEAERNCIARITKLGALATRRHESTIELEDVPDVAPPLPPRPIGFTSGKTPGYL